MFWSSSMLAEETRARLGASLNAHLADGADLVSQLRVIRWNMRGPDASPLQPILHVIEADLERRLDQIADRIVSLGNRAYGTARYVAIASRLPETSDVGVEGAALAIVGAARITSFLEGLRETRRLTEALGDGDSTTMLGTILRDFERAAFTLRSAAESVPPPIAVGRVS